MSKAYDQLSEDDKPLIDTIEQQVRSKIVEPMQADIAALQQIIREYHARCQWCIKPHFNCKLCTKALAFLPNSQFPNKKPS